MNAILRNVLGIILGVIVGGAVNGGLVVIGPMIIPPPAGVDMTTVEGMSAGMDLLGPEHFAVPFLAHALGTLVGGLVAYFVAASQKVLAVYFIGVLYLIGGHSSVDHDSCPPMVHPARSYCGLPADGMACPETR